MDPIGNSAFSCKCAKLNFLKFGSSQKASTESKVFKSSIKGGQKRTKMYRYLPVYIARGIFARLYCQANFAKPLWFLLQCLIAVRPWDLVLTLSDYWCTRSTLGVPSWDLTNICKNIVKKTLFIKLTLRAILAHIAKYIFGPCNAIFFQQDNLIWFLELNLWMPANW